MNFLERKYGNRIFLIMFLLSLGFFSCEKQGDISINETDSLIIPLSGLIHLNYNESQIEETIVKFKIIKGSQILFATPQITYIQYDSTECDYPFDLPDIQINGLNYFQDIDTLLKLDRGTFFNDFFRVNYRTPNFDAGDQWRIGFMIKMNNGRYLRNRYETVVTWDNSFSGTYDAHIIYYKSKNGNFPYDIYADSSFTKELIAINTFENIVDFAFWGNSDKYLRLFGWANDSISFTINNWTHTVINGDPNDATLTSHMDSISRKIYLYYYYQDNTGYNIFRETLTPM